MAWHRGRDSARRTAVAAPHMGATRLSGHTPTTSGCASSVATCDASASSHLTSQVRPPSMGTGVKSLSRDAPAGSSASTSASASAAEVG